MTDGDVFERSVDLMLYWLHRRYGHSSAYKRGDDVRNTFMTSAYEEGYKICVLEDLYYQHVVCFVRRRDGAVMVSEVVGGGLPQRVVGSVYADDHGISREVYENIRYEKG